MNSPLQQITARLLPALAVSLSLVAAAYADETPDPVLDAEAGLGEYLALAASRNPYLKAAFSRWKAALERMPQVRALPDPRFNYTYFVQEVETRVGPQKQKYGVIQAFPWLGTLKLREDRAAQAAAVAQQDYEKTKLRLFYRVKAAYYEYWYLAQAIAVTKEHVTLVINLEGVSRTRFKVGTVANSAVIQAQVELAKLDDRLRTLESLRTPIMAKLNAALNRATHLPIAWPRSLPEYVASFSDEEAAQWLAGSSPDLRRLDHLAAKAEADVKLAAKSYYPDISLGVAYVDTDDALNPDAVDSGKDAVIAMVSIKLPIWYGKYRAAEREAHHRRTAVELERAGAAKRLDAELRLALYHLRDAERKVALYGDTLVPKAAQSLQVVKQGFAAGNTGFIALIDAERLFIEFQLLHHRAQADRGQRLAEIEMLTNRSMPGAAPGDE